jgi:myosin heavy subunit
MSSVLTDNGLLLGTDIPIPDGESSQDEDDSTLAGSTGSSPSSPSTSLPMSPTAEERATQLQQALSQLSEERSTLTASLKATRRDAQKADAALRADIEGLKRASEKQAAGEHRARQKILALQETVKQTTATTASMEEETAEIERSLPDLKAALEQREREHEQARAKADKARSEREHAEVDARRRADASRSELSTLANRLDRLATRKEKLESGTIADLEEQLRHIREEIERAESDPISGTEPTEEDSILYADDIASHHSVQGSVRSHAARVGITPGPIQRPQASAARVVAAQQPVSPTNRLRTAAGRRPISHSAALSGTSTKSNSSSRSLPSATASIVTASQSSSSVLSGRAPPFEPRRGATLNPASTAFEPKSILMNPNRVRVTGGASATARTPQPSA